MKSIYNVNILDCSDYELDKIRKIENDIFSGIDISLTDLQYWLDFVCFEVRSKLANSTGKDLKEYNFRNKCDRAQAMVGYYFDTLGVSYHPISTLKTISTTAIRHFSLIAFLGGKSYLIDPTYNQFFEEKNCSVDDFSISSKMVKATPNPGYFVSKMSEDEKEKICLLLEKGYGCLDECLAGAYGNSFYKTRVGVPLDVYLNSEINGNIYIKSFMKSDDELIKSYEKLKEEDLILEPISLNLTRKL